MRKRVWFSCLLFVMIGLAACDGKKKKETKTNETDASARIFEIKDDIKFCESTLPYKGGLLIANFGASELNPLNQEGKGYIVKWENGKTETLIPASGVLSGPKGMGIKDHHLFICDVNKIVVYNLEDLTLAPVSLLFPQGDLFVNDIVILKDVLYVTVTNSGKIYTLDVTDPANISGQALTFYAHVPGANGIVTDGSKLYVASYPPDGVTKEENVIYVINQSEQPIVEKLIDRAGQYDGLALSADNKTLYFTSWINGEIGKIKLDSKEIELLLVKTDIPLSGPADMSFLDGKLYIPDLPNHRVVVLSL